MRKFITYSCAFFGAAMLILNGHNLYAQSGPGGVGSSISNSVWLDAHAMGLPDGSPVGVWNDFSGNGNNFVQGASVRQPVYTTAGVGGIPTITFDGLNDVLTSGSIPAIETPNLTYFIVYDRTTTTSDMLITSDYTSAFNKWRTYMNNGQNTIISAQYSPNIRWVRYTDPPGASFFSSHITPSAIRTYNQGNLMMTRTLAYTTPTGHNHIFLGNKSATGTGTYIYTGQISEVIIYNTALNPLQRIMVENYLGAKYGMSIPVDRYAYDATHRFGLIGLGNDGTNTQTSARGAGILELSGAASMEANEHFLVAHTDFSTSEYNLVDLPASLPAHQRLQRTWRVGETGDVGTTTLTFHLGPDDFAVPETYRLLIDEDGVFTDATTLAGTYDEVAETITFTVNLSDGQYFTISGILSILDIHSITDGPWSEETTWDCTCIPAANDRVFIDPLTEVTVDVDAFTDLLRIEFLGSLVMDTDVTLDINADFEILGETDFTNGTISLTGDVDQTVHIISTAAVVVDLNNLYIENTSVDEVTFLERAFRLNGTMSPVRGNIVIDPSTRFIVSSTSATDGGRIGPIIPPTNFTGEFEVQRFIPPGLADWRDLCSPVIGSTFNDWDPDLAMSGPDFPDGCAFGPDGCFRSVTYTDHSIFTEILTSTAPILNGRGFEIFVGNDLETFDGTTLTSTGTLNDFTDVVKSYTTGWTIFGNPYASPISFATLTKAGGVGDYFYVYDPASGAYEWFDGASGTSSLPEITEDGLIATGQAVWIFATSAGSITLNQFDKSSANATYIRSHEEGDASLHLILDENSSTYSCTVMLEEKEGALDGADDLYDIRHLATGLEKAPSLAVQTNDAVLRKNFILNNGRDKSFTLHSSFLNDGYYTLSIENWGNFRAYQKILIFDRLTGETVNLKENNYVFYASADNPEAKSASRFTLILSNSVDAAENDGFVLANEANDGQLNIKQMGNIIDVQSSDDLPEATRISITNVLGQEEVFVTSAMILNGSNMITLPAHLKGLHIITLRTGDQLLTQKIML